MNIMNNMNVVNNMNNMNVSCSRWISMNIRCERCKM